MTFNEEVPAEIKYHVINIYPHNDGTTGQIFEERFTCKDLPNEHVALALQQALNKMYDDCFIVVSGDYVLKKYVEQLAATV